MKKFSFIVALVAAVLNFSTANADNYNDYVSKMMTNSSLFTVEASGSDVQAMDSAMLEVNTFLADVLRSNITEVELTQMDSFISRPEYKAAENRIEAALSDSTCNYNKQLFDVAKSVMNGETPKDIASPKCSADYRKSFERYWETSQAQYMIKDVVVKNINKSMLEDGDTELKAVIDFVTSYLERNMKTLCLCQAVEKVQKEDLDTVGAIADQSFYPSYKQTVKALCNGVMALAEEMSSEE